MITPSMTYKEMYDHFAADLKKVEYRKEYYKQRAIKEFRKAKKFPAWKWYEYETPQTRNKYVIFYYAKNQNFIEHPLVNSFVDIFFDKQRYVVKWGASSYKHTPETPMKLLRILQVYSSHFLSRYNERFLKDDSLSSNDVACHYLSRNDFGMPIEITEEINRNIEQYGEGATEGFIVKDGLCFTQTGLEGLQSKDGNTNNDKIDAKIIVYTTFITKSMMTDGQRSAVEKEHIEKWFQANWEILKESKGGTLKLRLEP